MNAIKFIQQYGVKKAREVVEGSPSNAESYQDGYYFRTNPEFQFHNGFHHAWNLTDNDGEWFKKRGFSPVVIADLKRLVEDIDLLVEHSLSGCWGIEDIYGIEGTGMYLDGYAFYSNAEEKAELDRLQLALDRTVKAFGGEHV